MDIRFIWTTSILFSMIMSGVFSSAFAQNYQKLETYPVATEDLENWPSMETPNLSPDGKHISAIVSNVSFDLPILSIWKTDALDQAPSWLPSKEMIYIFADFLGNNKLIWLVQDEWTRGSYKRFQRQIHVSNFDGSDAIEPFRQKGTQKTSKRAANGRLFYTFNDGERVYIEERTSAGQKIIELNTRTGKKRNIAAGSADYAFPPEGVDPVGGDILVREALFTTKGDDYEIRYELRKAAKSKWEKHPELSYRIKNREKLSIGGFDGSTDRLAVITDRWSENTQVHVYNISTRKWDAEPLFAVPGYDVLGLITQSESKKAFPKIIGIDVAGPSIEAFYFDDYWARLSNSLKQQFPNDTISISDRRLPWQAGRRMAIVSIGSMNRPTEYLLYDNGAFKKLGSRRPNLDNSKLPTSKWIKYKARDGMEIPAILTLPFGYDKTKHGPIPLVVHPHGGPWARDYMGWDGSGWIPHIASRGIAVLQPQYRGSDGLGKTLWKAGDMEWGQKMQDDKDDGAAYLVNEGIADPERMAIYGYSYGGFAAIAASVRPNSPYQCAISGAGVSNLQKLGNLWGGNRISRVLQGRTVKGMDPIENVSKANIPILLYHGDHDRQADTFHSREFNRAMKSAGKDVIYKEIKGMWHQFPFRPSWRKDMLDWVEEYLKSDKCGLL